MTIEIANIILSAVSAISAAIVAGVAWAALRRFKSQKWWERRVESHLKVLDALADADAYYDRELRAAVTQSEAPAEQIKDLAERARNADQEIQKVIDLAELFISKDAHRRLIQYKKDIARADQNVGDDGFMKSWTDHIRAGSDATRNCQADMIKITKKDLKLP